MAGAVLPAPRHRLARAQAAAHTVAVDGELGKGLLEVP